jgi:cupin superfamily acireductone dioxygenase involved in methionine salvage
MEKIAMVANGSTTYATIEWAQNRLLQILEMPFDRKTVSAADHIEAARLLCEMSGWRPPQRQGVAELSSQSARSPVTAADQVAAIRLLAELKGWLPPSVKS